MIYLNTLLAEAKLKLNIPSDIKKLHKLFKKNGKQLYVVGGAVRDAILGKSPKDFDLTTDAKPDEVEKIVKQGGLKSIPVGKAEERFDEDPLRRLRAVRFAGSVGGRMTKDTWAALKQNSDISGVSAERIRDEFIKGVTKAKKVPNYFKMLKTLGMFKQIFPGLSVMSLSKLSTNDYIIQMAYILRSNNPDKIKTKLNGLKYTNKEVNDIWLLLYMSRPAEVIKDLPAFKRLKDNSTLTTSQISQWARIYSNNIKKLWNWKISTTAKDAIAKGLKGKDIGDYIKSKEEELFLS